MMKSQTTAIPKLFIGMDIHKKSWSVYLRTDLFDHKGFSMPPVPQKLADYVFSHFTDHEVSLTYEAGCCGFSAARYFLNIGWQVKVVNPNDVLRSDKQLYQKTDKLDCRHLCKQLQQDQLRGIYIPGEEQEQLRSLLRQRNQVVKLLRNTKSHIKALLLFHGITPRCKPLLRSYLIESSWVAIRTDPEIQAYYRRHAGKNPKVVIVKVAHKMCRRILSVIKNETPCQNSYGKII